MIRFVPSSAAEPLSDALWSLSRPPGMRGDDVTSRLFGWIDDLTGARWLVVDTEHRIPVHAEAVLGGIAEILAPWVGHGIAQQDIDALGMAVESHRGGVMTPWEFFPQVFKDLSKTQEDMITAGLLTAGGGA